MRIFARIAKLLPMAILLTFGLLLQALVLTQHGRASALFEDAGYAIIICEDGELREITVDADGNPASKNPIVPPCAFCLAAEHLFLSLPQQEFTLATITGCFANLPQPTTHPDITNAPEQPNCLDPPRRA